MGDGKILMRLNSIQTVEVVNKGERSVMYSGLKSLGSSANSNERVLIQPYAKSHLRRKHRPSYRTGDYLYWKASIPQMIWG